VWRSIFSAKIVVKQGARWRIGSRYNIPLIGEPWLGAATNIPPIVSEALLLQQFKASHLIYHNTKRKQPKRF